MLAMTSAGFGPLVIVLKAKMQNQSSSSRFFLPSSELASQFKVAFDEVRALNWERLGI